MSAPFDPNRRANPYGGPQPQAQQPFSAGYQNPQGQQYQSQTYQQPQQQFSGYSSPPFQQQASFQQPTPGFGPADLLGGNAQLGLTLGTQALSVGQDYVNKNIDKLVPKQKLKSYFNVTNSYVLQKILLILIPFRHKSWQRVMSHSATDGQSQQETYCPPRDDINAPDLYIPAMAFVTYVLLVGLNTGLKSKFHPEVLGKTATKSAILVFLEWGIIKLGLYIFSLGADLNALDILAVIGYNFVGMIFTVVADLLLGKYGKWFVFSYVSLSMFFFVLRSLRQNFLPESTEALVITQRRRRINFLFAIVCLQVIVSFISILI